MIDQFRDKAVKVFFETGDAPGPWRSFSSVARRKLDMLNAAEELGDLLAPPGNRLEQLKGNQAGQWSIRINCQWRICFRRSEKGATDVEIVDYH